MGAAPLANVRRDRLGYRGPFLAKGVPPDVTVLVTRDGTARVQSGLQSDRDQRVNVEK